MTCSGNDDLSKQPDGNNYDEDEIDLIDYFLVLGKYKLLIILGSMLPPLLVGFWLYLSPKDYTISYTYDVRMGEKEFKVIEDTFILEDTFFSQENLQKLTNKLRENAITFYADRIDEDLSNPISFEVFPSFSEAIDPSKTKNFQDFEKVLQLKGSLLIMHIRSKSKDNIHEIARICRDNFEHIVPLYSVRNDTRSTISRLKEEMAGIEEARFSLNQRLEREMATLEKLKSSTSETEFELPNDLVLQFNNVAQNSPYLPLAYQIQALKTQIIDIEDQIRAQKEKHSYDSMLLDLNLKVFDHLKKDSSMQQFYAFLKETLQNNQNDPQEVRDYLGAHIKRIENTIANRTPIVEKPMINSVAKGTVKKSALVFAVAFMTSIFVAFLREATAQHLKRAL